MHQLIDTPKQVARDHYLIRIRHDGPAPEPGQFISIKACEGTDPLLRRPFSVFNHDGTVLEIIVRVVGRGTGLISRADNSLDIIGPLGRGFTLETAGHALLVGGGVGCAPLFYLAKRLRKKGATVTMIFGASSAEYVYCADRFRKECDEFHITTDDGSEGHRGLVTDLMEKLIAANNFTRVYTCGPTKMMKKTTEIARGVPVEISVENYFGCGFGICAGCTIETTEGIRRACVNGPVFDGTKVLFNSLE
ncbi:MAG TPA: dihydroorotate dehydrogenase electron transfer subunit [Spirochaetota bacterium]|nr:dihydroorotate dehydrogenase electron transfer subunit [Spirochaetota bacterium]HPI88678.1 dihydroorotate dehydrogenase electron transfer subunit [Spirochaetota bacterium]HPR49119.1 dihydroorotate dehydrogenase electron transfer subunit [Spirochaetota bacterium]